MWPKTLYNNKTKRMVAKKIKQKNLTTPPLILGNNVGEKIIYTYYYKKDTYFWGKT